MALSLLDTILQRLAAEASKQEVETGQGRNGGKEKYDLNVGIGKGIRKAADVVRDVAKSFDQED